MTSPRGWRWWSGLLLLSGLAFAAPGAAREPFAPPDLPPQYLPDHGYDLQHVRLDLRFDWDARSVSGTATETLTPRVPGLRQLVFDAAGLAVRRVRVGGAERPFELDPAAETLTVDLGQERGPQDRLEVAIEYAADHPRNGLFFVGPDAAYPDKPKQIYSQGESRANHFWFPVWDNPNDHATWEVLATVRQPFQAVSNGALVETLDRGDGWRTFHWSLEQPQATYLISVVVGELVKVADTWRGIPVEFWVPPGHEEEGRLAFGRTPDMLEYFSTLTGFPYPFPRYSQTVVYDYMWGGMENTTTTTETATVLHPARVEPDASSARVVSHELAHQWFGDLLGFRSWSDSWLSEGFADYFELLYRAHVDGEDELPWLFAEERRSYLREDRNTYRRPLVTERYEEPERMFDRHAYNKGALVLHMLRFVLGDDGFWKGLREYVRGHAFQTVTTADLRASMEEATGVSLGALFDEYVYGAGYPELKVRWRWDAEGKRAILTVEQTQEITAETGYFSFPLEVELLGESGGPVARVQVRAQKLQEIEIPAAARPQTVVIDPGGWILKTVDFDKPLDEWIAQLRDKAVEARLEAVRELGEAGGMDQARAVEELGRVLREDPSHGIRQTAADSLAGLKTDAALAALLPGLADKDSRVREAVLTGLGSFPEHPELIPRIVKALESDPNDYVRQSAARALGAFGAVDGRSKEVLPVLEKALSQRSYLDKVPAGALEAIGHIASPDSFALLARYARYGSPQEARDEAMDGLAKIGKATNDDKLRERVREELEKYLADPIYNVRRSLYGSFEELGDPAAIPALEKAARHEVDTRQRLRAEQAIRGIQEEVAAKSKGDEALRERVLQLERETELLRSRLEGLEEEKK
jgi:aminopeptidase N